MKNRPSPFFLKLSGAGLSCCFRFIFIYSFNPIVEVKEFYKILTVIVHAHTHTGNGVLRNRKNGARLKRRAVDQVDRVRIGHVANYLIRFTSGIVAWLIIEINGNDVWSLRR